MANARVRSWRSAFSPLREAPSPAVAVLLLPDLLSQMNTLVGAVSDLPPQEVAEDISVVMQALSPEFLLCSDASSRSICGKVCHLLVEVTSRAQMDLKPPLIASVLCFFHSLIEGSASSSKELAPQPELLCCDASERLKAEALQALGQVIHENGGQISPHDVTRIMNLLLNSVKQQEFAPPGQSMEQIDRSGSWSEVGQVGAKARLLDCQRLVFVAMGNLLSHTGLSINNDTWNLVIKVLRDVMDFLAFGNQLMEDAAGSRYYAAVLRCVHLALSDPKGPIAEHVGGFVAALCMFFTYGLNVSSFTNLGTQNKGGSLNEINSRAAPGQAAYRPPHLRGKIKESQSSHHCQSQAGGRGFISSDSEQSDSEGSIGDGDRFKSSKARTGAILAIQALARAEPKALYAHWTLLLPTHDVLNPRRHHSTLTHSMLFDPVLKTRMAAASTISVMLEVPSRSFLQVAEYKESGRSGSFTTLSSSLGQIVVQLQKGLVHLVLKEPHGGMLMTTFKALSLLLTAAPFGRLPDELLPNIIHAVHKRTKDLLSSSLDQSSAVCVALNCLGSALSTVPASPQVAIMLAAELSGSKSTLKLQLLADLISYTQSYMPALVRVEALQALKAAVHNYPSVLCLYWDSISAVVSSTVGGVAVDSAPAQSFSKGASTGQNLRITDDKTVHTAVKLLDEFLRAVSGFRGTDDVLDDGLLLSPSPSVVPKPVKLFSSPGRAPPSVVGESQLVADAAGSIQWNEALQKHLPPMLRHLTPMVRGAALTCFAGLTSAVFSALPESKQNYILSAVTNTALQDETPSVRSSACRSIGVLVSFPQVAVSKDKLKVAVDVVLSSTMDASASVRITASWALANICDALRNSTESMDKNITELVSVTALAECALRLSKDGDKVRANAVRALGNLARFVDFGGDLCPGLSKEVGSSWKGADIVPGRKCATFPWLERMVQTFVSCVTTGNVKVQWNVCHALGNLFLNSTVSLSRMAWAASVYSILLLLLRDSANFKIRIHAASALAVPAAREDYGDSFHDVVQALVHALESLGSEQLMVPLSFKYVQALREQLTTTSLHILGLAVPEDYECLQDFLLKRGTFLEGWLKSSDSSAARTIASDCQCFDSSLEVTNQGAFDQAANGRQGAGSICCVNDEKLLPPPKERIWYALDGEESALYRKAGSLNRKSSIRKATGALVGMYRYGGHTNLLLLFEQLLAQVSSKN